MHVALIMAKEGSAGVAGKNLISLQGKSLLKRTIEDLTAENCFSKIYVSTNGFKIADEAHASGAEVIMRADELAANDRYVDAVNQAVSMFPEFETVTIPQVVQPFRQAGVFCEILSNHGDGVDSVVTVTPFEASVDWLFSFDDKSAHLKKLGNINYGNDIGRRNDILIIDNAIVSFTWQSWKINDGLTNWPYLGHNIRPFLQKRLNSNFAVDINNPDDVEWMKFVATYPHWRQSEM